MHHLPIPFDKDDGIYTVDLKGSTETVSSDVKDEKPVLLLPAVYQGYKTGRALSNLVPIDSDVHRRAFLAAELDVSRLNEIDSHLWLAGLKRPARPLHHQLSAGRSIVITESTDLHLLWRGGAIYLKPLPSFLLSHGVWERDLCKSTELHESAAGLLLSYIWLVARESDLRIAHSHGLLPAAVTWTRWVRVARAFVARLDQAELRGVNRRYHFGELRLGRVNWIWRLWATRLGWSFTALVRGYQYGYTQYSSFLNRNLAWLVSFTAWVALVLTAMQVGLATNQLKDSEMFQNAAYGFTIFAIMGPVLVVGLMLLIVLVLLLFNWKYAIRSTQKYSALST